LERIKCELCVLQYPYTAVYSFRFLKCFKVLYDFKLSDTEIVKSEPFTNPYKVLFEYHSATEKICNKENIPFCFISLSGDEFIERDIDHPNEKGHKKISEIIYRKLKVFFNIGLTLHYRSCYARPRCFDSGRVVRIFAVGKAISFSKILRILLNNSVGNPCEFGFDRRTLPNLLVVKSRFARLKFALA